MKRASRYSGYESGARERARELSCMSDSRERERDLSECITFSILRLRERSEQKALMTSERRGLHRVVLNELYVVIVLGLYFD